MILYIAFADWTEEFHDVRIVAPLVVVVKVRNELFQTSQGKKESHIYHHRNPKEQNDNRISYLSKQKNVVNKQK